MCAWAALVLGPNINAPMGRGVAPALAAVRKAQQNAASANTRELALIAALAERYSADPKAERHAFDIAYAEAMERIAARFPEDDDIQAFYAEALMDLTPWDYWEGGGAKPKGKTGEIVAALERVLARSPDHPGAIHYSSLDGSLVCARACTFPARRLAAAMPGAGHLVHMPFHLYRRRLQGSGGGQQGCGRHRQAYIAREKPVGIIDGLLSAQRAFADSLGADCFATAPPCVAAAGASRIVRRMPRAIPMAQPVAVAQYFAHAQFSMPAAVLALPTPGDSLPFVSNACWRSYAADRSSAARDEAAAIGQLKTSGFSALTAALIPASDDELAPSGAR
jgi:hypothetical protein